MKATGRSAAAAGMALVASLAFLSACSSTPPPPDWQMNAKASLERATAAYLAGNSRWRALQYGPVSAATGICPADN